MFNMGQISDQHILIMVDEHGTIEAHTHAHLELQKGEIERIAANYIQYASWFK